MVMRWSSKFFGVAGVLVAAPFLSAAEPPGDTVTLQATVEASADGQSGPTPLRVTVLDENGQKVTVNGGATADIKTFTIRLVGDGNGVVTTAVASVISLFIVSDSAASASCLCSKELSRLSRPQRNASNSSYDILAAVNTNTFFFISSILPRAVWPMSTLVSHASASSSHT